MAHEDGLGTRIALDAEERVIGESQEKARLLHAAETMLGLVSCSDPSSPEYARMRLALEAAGVVREGESLEELRTKALAQVGVAATFEEGVAAAAQRSADFIATHSLEPSAE